MGESNHSLDLKGDLFKLPKSKLKEIKDYQVIIGFSGFGNVGYLSLTHLVETLDLESIAFWGSSTWFHKGRLESLITVYQHRKSKTIIIVPRIPIHVSSLAQRFWDSLSSEILQWNCKEYIVIGGLKEDTRTNGSTDWAAYVPTTRWQQKYNQDRTLLDHLAMIGPLSSFISIGTTFDLAVLGLLAYCSYEDDPSAALFTVSELQKLTGIEMTNNERLIGFDYSFVPNLSYTRAVEGEDSVEYDSDEDDDDDVPGYDLNELI